MWRYHRQFVLALVMLMAAPALHAQWQVRDDIALRLSGEIAFNYSGSNGSSGTFNALGIGGTGQLSGYYYNPNFLSFTFQPYYHRAQAESIYETITTGRGFTASSNIFSGSRFPGSVSYTRTYDSSGEFGIPGVTGVVSHGNSQSFSLSWSALLERMPTLTATFSTTAGDSSIFGSANRNQSNSRNFSLQSGYVMKGFHLQGTYSLQGIEAEFPVFLDTAESQVSENHSSLLNLTVGHKLPLQGFWSLAWNRSDFRSQYRGSNFASASDGSANTLSTMASMVPLPKLNVSAGATYTDNVWGNLQQSLLGSGVPILAPSTSNRAYSFNAAATYSVFSRLAVQGRVNRYQLEPGGAFTGASKSFTQYSGTLTFSHIQRLLGSLTFSLGIVDTATQNGNNGASFNGGLTYLRSFAGWEIGGNFHYSQQLQTLDDFYTTSMYHYGASAKRRFSALFLSTALSGSRSGLQQFSGFSNHHETFTSSVQWWKFNLTGRYSQSSGRSVITPTGLVEISPGVPASVVGVPVFYGGESYGGGLGYQPFRRAFFNLNYSHAESRTAGGSNPVAPYRSNIFNSRFQYRLRKLDLDVNFTRLEQSLGMGNLPATVNSYYFRVSRWFEIF